MDRLGRDFGIFQSSVFLMIHSNYKTYKEGVFYVKKKLIN